MSLTASKFSLYLQLYKLHCSCVAILILGIFKSEPTKEVIDNLMNYYGPGGTCVLGPAFQTITSNHFLNKLDVVRNQAYLDAFATKVGRNFYEQSMVSIQSDAVSKVVCNYH